MHGLARLLTTILALLVCTATVGASVGVEIANRRAPALENFTAVTSPPLGNAIRRTYDAGGRLTQEVMGLNRDGTDGNPGDRRARNLTYVGGRLKSDVTDDGANGARLTILYSYDEKGRLRLEDEAWADPGAVGYHYVRTTEWTDGLNGSSFDTTVEWNAGALQGQVEGATHGVFHELGVTDGAGRVIEQWVQDAGNNAAPLERMRAVHDALGRPLAQRAEGLAATTYQYDRGTLAARTFGEDVTTYHYDTAGRLAEERSPVRGRVVHYQYHPLGNVSQQVMHAGNEVTTLDFDKAGNVVAKTLPGDGPPWRYAHTATGLLLRVAPPGEDLASENQTFRYDYFADGLLSDVVAPKGPRRHYTYDGRRRPFRLDLIGEGGEGPRTETWTWQGNVETHEGLGGWNTVTRYDGRGRASLIEHSRAGGAPESFTAVTSRALRYGPFDGPVAIREVLTDFAGGDGLSSLPRNSTYTYDAAGRVRTATEPEGVIGYEYDLLQGHRRVVSTLPGGQTQGQILDSMGRVHQITTQSEQEALTLEWNASGTLASITGRGLAESRSYDPASPHRLTGIDIRREGAPVEAAPLVHLTYLHNFAAAGQATPWLTVHRSDDGAPDVVSRYFVDAQLRLLRSEEDAVTRTYSWHADGRRDLEEVSAPGVEHSIRHSYDAFGQLEGLTRWTGPNEPAEYTVEVQSDGVGQVTDYADLETGLSRHLVWDAEGHLSTQVLTPAPALGQPASTWAYRYNARDQRVAKVAVGGPVAPTAYLWGAGGLLRETGASTTDYVHGAGMILAAGGTRLAHDHLGSPIASRAQNALNPETGTFDGWGRYFSGAAPNADGSTAPTTHVGYTGHAYDADSDLTYAEARWYDPDIGAFLSRDPVAGSLTEPGTLEPFGYVRGNPLFYVDPDGRVSDEALDAQSEYRTRRHAETEALSAAKAAARGALFARLPGRLSDRVRSRVVLTLDRVLNDASLAEANSLAANPDPTAAAAVGHWSDVEKRALQATDEPAAVFLAHYALDSQEGLEGQMRVAKVATVASLVVAAPILAPTATTAAGAAASGHSVYEDVKSGHVGLGTAVNAVLTVAAAVGLAAKAVGLVGEASAAGKVAAPVRVGEASKGGETVFRVQGGVLPNASKVRFGLSEGGRVTIAGDDMLFVNLGQEGRALEFLAKRGETAELVRFDITPEFAARLRAEAVPQRLGRQFPGRPQVVDPTRAADQFGIPSSMFDDLINNIVPETFRGGRP